MHFISSKSFETVCFELQTSPGFSTWTALSWSYDKDNQIASVRLVNPILEIHATVTISTSEATLLKQIKRLNKEFVKTFKNRKIYAFIPYKNLVTEYPNWKSFRNSWLVRKNKNIGNISVPLLLSYQSGTSKTYVTLFITKTNEFYSFAIENTSENDSQMIMKELEQIVSEAFSAQS